jgi:hypothetical protein
MRFGSYYLGNQLPGKTSLRALLKTHRRRARSKVVKTHHCPVCGKPLTEHEYEHALGILGEREKHLKREKAELLGRLKQAHARVKEAREEGKRGERQRTKRLLQGKEAEIQKWKDRVRQLKRGSTPQTEGLEFEHKLAERLKREFPADDVKPMGRGGDILHTVRTDKRPAGVIIYECKREPKIRPAHIRQAFRAKKTREADFAVLVTTGQKQGFGGLAHINSVLVVAPLGVLPLVSLLRLHLIEMLRAKITKKERSIIAERLVKYVTSPQFKNPIEEVIQRASDLQDLLLDEALAHKHIWEKRWEHYQVIGWDSSHVQANLQLVLQGKEPTAMSRPKVPPPPQISARKQLPPPRQHIPD